MPGAIIGILNPFHAQRFGLGASFLSPVTDYSEYLLEAGSPERASTMPSRLVSPRRISGLKAPMREERPAARITAAIFIPPFIPELLHLRDDTQGDFLRALAADGQADGAVHPGQIPIGKSLLPQGGIEGIPFAATADHADISGLGAQGLGQNLLVMQMSSGDDDHIIVGFQPAKALIK